MEVVGAVDSRDGNTRLRSSSGGGARGRGGGIIGIEGRKGETMGTTQRKWDFFDASCEPAHTSLSEKKQGKNRAYCTVYMLVTKPRNLHYRYCPLQYWYGLQY